MKTLVIIPVRAFDRGKTRLAPLLNAAERKAFSRACLRHVVRVVRRVAGAKRTLVVSRAGEVLGLGRRLGVGTLREHHAKLNSAVQEGVRYGRARGMAAVAVVHADLPKLSVADVRRLLRAVAKTGGAALAPDEAGLGTNALALRPPGNFRFSFGADSFARHRAEARGRRMRIRVVRSPGLGFDVDTPETYQAYRGEGRPASGPHRL